GRAKSDRTNAAITRRDEGTKIRLFQKSSRSADGSGVGMDFSSRRQKERSSRFAAAGGRFRRQTRQAPRLARSVRSGSRTTRRLAAGNGATNGSTARI